MKKILIGSLIICSSIVGVGFVSGKEVYNFFAAYGIVGFVFSLAASVAFGFVIYYFLNNAKDVDHLIFIKKPQNCVEKCEKPYQNGKNIKIIAIFNYLLKVGYIIISAVMISGFRSVLNGFLPPFITEIVVFILLGLLLLLLQKEIVQMKTYSIFFMITFSCLLCYLFCKNFHQINFELRLGANNLYGLCLVAFYISMNIFTCLRLLVGFGKDMTKVECKKMGIVCGTIIGILLSFSTLLLINRGNGEMPLLSFAGGGGFGAVYVCLIILGLLTTLFSTIFGAASIGEGGLVKRQVLAIYFSYILSSFGFSKLVAVGYPVLGFFTMLALVTIVLILKNRKSVVK